MRGRRWRSPSSSLQRALGGARADVSRSSPSLRLEALEPHHLTIAVRAGRQLFAEQPLTGSCTAAAVALEVRDRVGRAWDTATASSLNGNLRGQCKPFVPKVGRHVARPALDLELVTAVDRERDEAQTGEADRYIVEPEPELACKRPAFTTSPRRAPLRRGC